MRARSTSSLAASASVCAACFSPSAWMTLARLPRSASACRAMARIMVSSRSMSLISTLVTFMPQAAVFASSICWMAALSLSRWASISSISCWPATERSVVCASWLVASQGLMTCRMAFSGSTMRKYTTALTFTDTLSLEITSCFGTLSTTVRKLHLLHLLNHRQYEPHAGALDSGEAAEREHHAALVLLEDADRTHDSNSNMTTMTGNEMFMVLLLILLRLHPERQIHHLDDARLLARTQRTRCGAFHNSPP